MPAMPKRIAAGMLRDPPASIMSATKTGMPARRPRGSAFGSCASGAGIAGVAIPDKCTALSVEGMEPGCPVRRADEIGGLRCDAGEAPRAVVGEVAGPGRRRLDLRPLPPLVEARDGDDVGARGERGAPEVVVCEPALPRAEIGRFARAGGVIARADARGAQQ